MPTKTKRKAPTKKTTTRKKLVKKPLAKTKKPKAYNGPCIVGSPCIGMRTYFGGIGEDDLGLTSGIIVNQKTGKVRSIRVYRTRNDVVEINYCPWCGAKVNQNPEV